MVYKYMKRAASHNAEMWILGHTLHDNFNGGLVNWISNMKSEALGVS